MRRGGLINCRALLLSGRVTSRTILNWSWQVVEESRGSL